TRKYSIAYLVLLPASIIFVLPFGGMFFLNGTITLSNYILCMLLALGFADPLIRLTNFFDNIALLTVNEKAINQLLNEKELELHSQMTKPTDYSIAFNNVSFAYEDLDVLKDVSFTCKPNTVTALVGPSGSGKSTIAKLIARFWDIDTGTITLGGVDTSKIPFETLMDLISYVSQDAYLFNTSILENIRMGKPDATEEEIKLAAKNAVCDEFIKETDKGYETNAGDAGDRFSGGQKQRLSIARALLKNAPIVILDEATAFTDPENEDKIQQSINQLIKGKTVIVIAHRLSTVVNADNIIVVDEGRIVDQGTHEKLLARCLKYKIMWGIHLEAMSWDLKTKEVNGNA
ncbi:MAG: ABC transporter ATP-binding protein/permease, partial [Firmicutes bacterium]|nr:ABC transporter ATP-binding protein/permease [Bacillota bacterium]